MSTTEQETTETEQDDLEQPDTEQDTQEPREDVTDDPDPEQDAEPDTFDRPYVEKLRKEAADARVKAKRADDLAAALWLAQVTATGRLADATDIPLSGDVDPLDADAVTKAIDDLLAKKPHLASRKPSGNIGQGSTPVPALTDLAGMLRGRA